MSAQSLDSSEERGGSTPSKTRMSDDSMKPNLRFTSVKVEIDAPALTFDQFMNMLEGPELPLELDVNPSAEILTMEYFMAQKKLLDEEDKRKEAQRKKEEEPEVEIEEAEGEEEDKEAGDGDQPPGKLGMVELRRLSAEPFMNLLNFDHEEQGQETPEAPSMGSGAEPASNASMGVELSSVKSSTFSKRGSRSRDREIPKPKKKKTFDITAPSRASHSDSYGRSDVEEIHQRSLVSRDPNADETAGFFNFKYQEYVLNEMKMGEVTIFHFEGSIVYNKTAVLAAVLGGEPEPDPSGSYGVREPIPGDDVIDEELGKEGSSEDILIDDDDDDDGYDFDEMGNEKTDETTEESESNAEESENENEEGVKKKKRKKKKKKLPNQFNFSDRGALTTVVITSETGVQTAPPPTATFKASTSQWIIHDEYQRDYSRLMAAKEKEKKERQIMSRPEVNLLDKTVILSPEDSYFLRLFQAAKIMERIVTQNTYEDIAFDCQFYDDPADKFRETEGSLLPLWDFSHEECENVIVTDIKWSPRYYDMFAASFGTYQFHSLRLKGIVCIYTLKNPSHPEYKARFKTGAQSVDIHPKEPFYVATGLYSGAVAVTNIKDGKNVFTVESGLWHKHNGIVWEVRWAEDHRDRQIGFYSAGTDGRVIKWLVEQQSLVMIPIITLEVDPSRLSSNTDESLNASPFPLTARAYSLAFHPVNSEIFLVGTVEGFIYKCSTLYSSSYQYVYKAHDLSVYRISYNTYNPEIFVSCSCDWRIKIWEDCQPGYLTAMKVSPNLRVPAKPLKKKSRVKLEPKKLESMKLEKVLSYVREPPTYVVDDVDLRTEEEKNRLKTSWETG